MKVIHFFILLFFVNVSAQERENQVTHKFYFGTYFSLDNTNLNIFKQNNIGAAVGINVSRFISKRIELSAALAFSSLNFKLENLTFGDQISSTQGFSGPPLTVKYRDHFLETPIKFNFHFVKRPKLTVFASLGGGVAYYLGTKRILEGDLSSYPELKKVKKIKKQNDLLLPMLLVGIGVDYMITDKLKLSFSPMYRRYIKSDAYNKTSFVYSAVGFNFGTSFTF